MILVHVIPPAGLDGDRHEEHFADGTTDDAILACLTVCGGPLANSPPRQDGYGRLSDGSKYLDDPLTVVCVGVPDGKGFKETRRLRGPA